MGISVTQLIIIVLLIFMGYGIYKFIKNTGSMQSNSEQGIKMENEELEYVGFWARTGATLIDGIIIAIIIYPILTAFYGEGYWISDELIKGPMDFLLSYVFPIVAVIIFWVVKQATPGKMAISAKIVDAKTGNTPSIGQYIGRYFAYIISTIPLGLGLFWVGFDSRKQGWHDKLAGTVVVRPKNRTAKTVSFD